VRLPRLSTTRQSSHHRGSPSTSPRRNHRRSLRDARDQLDVQNPADIEAFASRIREQFLKLNVLINNAGISKMEDLGSELIDFSVMQSTIQINMVGVLHTSRQNYLTF
jgi:short-subunit dehydrogenase involved in D-alanine esterification of teichoic acids